MEPRDKWIDEAIRRQDNIDPIRRIPNGALFQGTLIKGNRRLNKIQRLGAIFLGLLGLGFGGLVLVETVAAIHSRNFFSLISPAAILSPLSIWFAWRIFKNAWVNDPRKRYRKN
jgi:hypothetical protein